MAAVRGGEGYFRDLPLLVWDSHVATLSREGGINNGIIRDRKRKKGVEQWPKGPELSSLFPTTPLSDAPGRRFCALRKGQDQELGTQGPSHSTGLLWCVKST